MKNVVLILSCFDQDFQYEKLLDDLVVQEQAKKIKWEIIQCLRELRNVLKQRCRRF